MSKRPVDPLDLEKAVGPRVKVTAFLAAASFLVSILSRTVTSYGPSLAVGGSHGRLQDVEMSW